MQQFRSSHLTSAALLLGGLVLAACGRVDQSNKLRIGGRTVAIDSTVNQNLKGERVVDQYGFVASPAFVSWSGEVEEYLTTGGKQEAEKLCGGEAALVSLTRAPFPARTANMRFRCL